MTSDDADRTSEPPSPPSEKGVPGQSRELGEVLPGLLSRLERLVDPRTAVRAAQGQVGGAWRSVTREEPRLQVTAAILVAIAMMLALPSRVASHPRWVLPGLAIVLLIGVFVAKSRGSARRSRVLRIVSLSLIAVMSLSNAASAGRLIVDLVRGVGIRDPAQLLLTGAAIWFTNVIVFGLWYWEFDRGGPVNARRALGPTPTSCSRR